jgi:hypothetical protein
VIEVLANWIPAFAGMTFKLTRAHRLLSEQFLSRNAFIMPFPSTAIAQAPATEPPMPHVVPR